MRKYSFANQPVKSTIQVEIFFLEPWDASNGPPYLRQFSTEEYPATNFTNKTYNVIVIDARPNSSGFTLDKNAFAFRESESLSADIVAAIRKGRHEDVVARLYDAVEKELKAWIGAKKALIFDHGYRKRNPEIEMAGRKNAYAKGQPGTVVSALQRTSRLLK